MVHALRPDRPRLAPGWLLLGALLLAPLPAAAQADDAEASDGAEAPKLDAQALALEANAALEQYCSDAAGDDVTTAAE
jgi:hypothetical protein